jgi:Rrf2 family nitric oxide-sensitive transcriptional repressor
MQLSYFADYSLRLLIYSAAHTDRWCTSDEIAQTFTVSRHHIVKVVHALARQGYLETQRGRGGGFRLAQPAARIVVGEVVRKNEPTLNVVECSDHDTNTCPLAQACGLKGALRKAQQAFFATLDGYSIADFVRRPEWKARVMAVSQVPARAAAAVRPGG